MHTAVIAIALSFISTFASESREALQYFRSHAGMLRENMPMLTEAERTIACAIVAPELSQYSELMDAAESQAMYVFYVYQGSGDFSIGIFQMKPGFVEMLEQEIADSAWLKKRHGAILDFSGCKGEEKAKRRLRLNRLRDASWQMRYLAAFFDVATQRTKQIRFANSTEKVEYFATLYNSGFRSSPERVAKMREKTLFPHGDRRFNYGKAAAEFYVELQKQPLK